MHRRSSLKAACLALCFSGLEFSVLADESGIPPRLTGESVESLPEETSSVISDFCSGVYSGTESWCSGLMESPTLSGDCCGYKPTLEDHGIIYQGYLTQFYQGVAAGGTNSVSAMAARRIIFSLCREKNSACGKG
jgi:hypothetical protein